MKKMEINLGNSKTKKEFKRVANISGHKINNLINTWMKQYLMNNKVKKEGNVMRIFIEECEEQGIDKNKIIQSWVENYIKKQNKGEQK